MGFDEHGPAYPDAPVRSGWEKVCKRKRADGPTPCYMGLGCDCLSRRRAWPIEFIAGWVIGIIILLLALFFLLWSPPAAAQEYFDGMPLPPAPHHHPPEDQELHDKFYKTWLMPDNRKYSCCSDQDCYPTIARPGTKTEWQARRREDGKWIDVPDAKVERERTPPDGRAHVCMPGPNYPDMVYCFAPPRGV